MGLTLEMMAAIDGRLFDSLPDTCMSCTIRIKKFSNFTGAYPLSITKDFFCEYLISEAGYYRTIYHSPDSFRKAFEIWYRVNVARWRQLYATMCYDYDPISNYDRTETWTDEAEHNTNETSTNKNTATSTSNGSGNNERREKVAAFDLTTPTERSVNTETGTTTNSDNSTVDGNSTRNIGGTQKNIKTGRAYGNIGVTTTQEMIEAERKVINYDFMGQIVEEYKNRFCILIY